jgi:hypothetical protein
VQPALEADNFTFICEPIVQKMRDPRVSQPYDPPRLVKGIRNPVSLVRKRTIPTERLQLVGEVRANFCG